MLRIALCDDNEIELKDTYQKLQQYCQDRPELDGVVYPFSGGFSLLDAMETQGLFDVYVLDIIMPEMNGIELGKAIREKDNRASIILLTSSEEYGVASYRIEAKDYVLKPCTTAELFASMDRVVDAMPEHQASHFVVPVMGGIHSIPYNKILYITYYQHKLAVKTISGETIESVFQRHAFPELMEVLLADGRFVQISASHVIHMQYVRRFTSRQFEMIDGTVLPLSRLYSGSRSIYMDYVMERN